MFDFLTPLTIKDFEQKTEYLLDSFIAKRIITLIYSPGGSGKSFLAAGIAKHADTQGMNVLYLDFDNSKDALESRGIPQKLIQPCPRVHYELSGSSQCNEVELLDNLEAVAHNNRFENTLIILDTLGEFVDVTSDNKAQQGFRKLKRLRDAGATVILLHHTTKSGSNYSGSNVIRGSVDNMYRLEKLESPQDEIHHLLTIEKDRVRIVDTAICTKVEDLSMLPINVEQARMTPEDRAFVVEVKTVISKKPGINKTELLTDMGYEKTDKKARDRLDQFEELFWKSQKQGKTIVYQLLD